MHPLFTQFRHSLLGRLKTIELSSISGSLERLPSQRQLFSTIMDRWRKHSEDGRFLFNLVYCYNSSIVDIPPKMSVRHIDLVLKTLGCYKPIPRLFAEEKSQGDKAPLGMLLLGHCDDNAEPGYYAMIYQESTYPKILFFSIKPNASKHTRAQIMSEGGWTTPTLKRATELPEVRLLITALWDYLTPRGVKSMPTKELLEQASPMSPLDDEFMARIHPVFKGNSSVSIVWASSDKVKPFNLSYCFELKTDIIEQFLPNIATENPIPLVVYWDGDNFVMSDDYYGYAAYRKLDMPKMRLAVLGEFPEECAQLEKKGGAEMLPPLIVSRKAVASTTPEYENWLLDQKLRNKTRQEVPSKLVATWLFLADLLGTNKTNERQLHNFLRDHPTTISAYATRVESEVSLGNSFRIDLIIRTSGVREEVTLVELEHHRHTIFTADGRPCHKVTHSCQQVRDWIQWLGENPNDPISKSLAGIKPAGLVIMGRSATFTDKDRRLLANLNENSLVKVLTYDEILDRFRDMILSQCDANE